MPLTEKEFQKDIKKVCDLIIGKKDKKNHKKCINATMCQYHKCNNELVTFRDSRLTEEERNKCHEHKKFSDMRKCTDKILKQKDFNNKHANLEHCIANKCPEDRKFAEEMEHTFREKYKPLPCEPCNKEQEKYNDALSKQFISSNDCKIIHNTYKGQKKCEKKTMNNVKKTANKIMSCRMKHCSIKKSHNNTKKHKTQKK